ncbi:MAG: hypothetical protein R3186_11290, partial [Ruegeria sp.]|nr:hypothetical protein [Ruegeria sp.]
GFRRSFLESLRFVAGSVPPVVFLCWSQWVTFGNPFLPGQYHMPMVNYTDRRLKPVVGKRRDSPDGLVHCYARN